jgi:hypothetical protein
LEDLWETVFLGLVYIAPKESRIWKKTKEQVLVSKNSKIAVRKWTVMDI